MKAGDPNFRIEPDDLLGALNESLLVAVADPDGGIEYVNDRFCEVWKYSRAELIGKHFRDFDSGSNPPALLSKLRKALRGGRPWRGEIRNPNADGRFRWIDATIFPMLDAARRPSKYVIIGSDVTAHKQTLETLRTHVEQLCLVEEELRAQDDALRTQNEELRASRKTIEEERAHYRELFDFAPAGYVITDVRGVILEANVGTEELLSTTRRQLVGRQLVGFVHPQSRRTFRELLRDLTDEVGVRQTELCVRRGAKECWAAVSVSPITSPSGAVEGLRWLLRDITEEKRRKDKLRETWERLNAVMQNARALIYVMDKQSRFVFINRRFEEVFDLSCGEVQGKSVYEVFPKNYADFFTANNRKVLKLRNAVEFEETAPPLADGVHTYISQKIPQFDARGKPTGVFGISTDITERKRAEEALRESEKFMQLVLNASRIGIWTHDFVADRTDWSPETCRIFGVEKFDGRGETFWNMVDAADRRRVRREFRRAIEQKCFYETEFRIVRPDGKKFWVRGQGQCEYDADEKPLRFLGTIQDISERRLAEQSAAENLLRFQNLVKISPYGIFIGRITGEETRIVYANEECLRIFGAESPAEVVGKASLDFLHPDYHEIARQRISAMKKELKPVSPLEEKIIALDGRVIDAEVTAAPVAEGSDVTVLVTMRDITERKKREERLRIYEKIIVNARDAVLITEAEPIERPGPRIVYANPAFTEMTGYTNEEIVGQTPRLLQGPKTSRAKLDAIRAALEKWKPVRASLTNYRKDGSEFEVDFDIFPIADESGWFVNWISIQRDVTEQIGLERSIRDSAAKYRVLFEQNPYPVFVIDVATNQILAVNQSAVRLYGYSREEFLKMTAMDIRPPEDVPSYFEYMKKIRRTKATHSVRVRHCKKNGETIDVELSSYAMNYEGRKARYVILQDVTERNRLAREARREQQEKIEVLESITEAFVSFDRRLRFIYVNSAAEKFLRNTAGELIGKPAREIFPDSVSAQTTEEFRRVLENGVTEEFEIYHELSQSWLRVRAYPTPSGLSVFWQDITERKLAERLIEEKNQLLEQTYDAIFIWRIDDGIIYWNQNAEQLYGYTRQEASGMNVQRLLKTVLPVPYENFINQLKKDGFWEGELIHTTKHGDEVIVEGRLHVIKREERDIIVLETLRDVTERRRIEAEMARAAQLSLVGELAAGLAHEIKNPLAGIKGVIDILLRRRQEPQFSDDGEREVLENVHHEIDRIDKTVRSLLHYSRPKPLEFKIAPLDETVRRAVRFAFHHTGFRSASRGKIATELELPEAPLFVAHDSAKIEDAVLNLILNAEDAIGEKEDGKIIVRLGRSEPDELGTGSALIEVADNGSGIAPENLARIFAPFQTTKKEGTGLGLSSVRRIARAHGGDCTVESALGEGSIFTIRLPFNDQDAAFLEAYNR